MTTFSDDVEELAGSSTNILRNVRISSRDDIKYVNEAESFYKQWTRHPYPMLLEHGRDSATASRSDSLPFRPYDFHSV
jgi:hypothetical protein